MGGESSHFVNTNGLAEDQYSTARDMARVARAAYFNSALARDYEDEALHVSLCNREDDSFAEYQPRARTHNHSATG